jgi:hypothetical protein
MGPYMTTERTGLRNPGCYARALADCCPKMSREHCMTEALLKAIALDDEIEVEGLVWLGTEKSKVLPTKRLTKWMLCKRHNEALSKFDVTVTRLFQTVEAIHLNFGEDRDEQHQISGDAFERWMLKTLCGYAVAELFIDAQGEQIVGWEPPVEWLEILFQGKPFTPPCGLHVVVPTHGKPIHTTRKLVRVAALTGANKEIYGLRLWLLEQEIALLMGNPLQHAPEGLLKVEDYKPTLYRPAAIAYCDAVKSKAVVFDWQTGPANGPFQIQMVKVSDLPGS